MWHWIKIYKTFLAVIKKMITPPHTLYIRVESDDIQWKQKKNRIVLTDSNYKYEWHKFEATNKKII